MSFAEISFLPFLVVVLVLDRLLPSKTARVWMLLIASCLFYGWWNIALLPLLFVTAVLDFFLGALVYRMTDQKKRRWVIAASITANMLFLGYFKYTNFGISLINDFAVLLGQSAPVLSPIHVVLPVGISFYTFQSMSYTLDVYKGEIPPEKKLSRFLCFVTLFPQLVAGPIVRASELLPQLQDHVRNVRRPAYFLILLGLFKKIVLADTVGPMLSDPAFADPAIHSPLALWLGAWAYAFQIFCDFSGYSDIAIGCGLLMGFEFPKNFAAPYLSQSIGEFWRRWHITLGSWFRDYVYIPLGGNRGSLLRWSAASLFVFFLSGLWHGANMTFVIWGLMHGVAFVLERLLSRSGLKLRSESPLFAFGLRIFKTVLTFNFVTLTWVFFRAQTLGEATTYLKGMFTPLGTQNPMPTVALVALGVAVFLHLTVEPYVDTLWQKFTRWPALAQGALAMVLGAFLYASSDSQMAQRAFIYFQF